MASAHTTVNRNLTTTTVAADPDLQLALAANSTYSFSLNFNWSEVNTTDGGVQVGFQKSQAGTTLQWTYSGYGATLGSGQTVSFINVSGQRLVQLSGTVVTGASTDTLQVIEALAQASGNPTTVQAGSILTLTLVSTSVATAGLQSQQIIALATQAAQVTGFTSQAGQLLNAILSDLAQTYDFEVNLRTFAFTFDTATVYQNNVAGAGPNILPADFLRQKYRENIYYIQGVRYVLVIVTQDEFDSLVQTSGWNSYPSYGYIDLSLSAPFSSSNPGQPGLMVWPPASGSFPVQLRYYCQPVNIITPETSAAIPWFPNSNYLITRLTGELMKLSDDERFAQFLGHEDEKKDTMGSAWSILRQYLKMKDNPEGSAKTVQLDRRRFGSQFANLKNTKVVGW